MKTSIIIVNYNGGTYTRQCLVSLFQYHSENDIEVIVVDNNSTDGSSAELPKEFPEITFIALPENRGFGPANNIGAGAATGEILFFVNNDTIFTSNILDPLVRLISRDGGIGIAAPKLLNEDGSFQLSFGKYPTIAAERKAKRAGRNPLNDNEMDAFSSEPVRRDWVTGAALIISREIFLNAGGFDERYFMYFEDIDLCKRVSNKGYSIQYYPAVSMIHLGGKSYGSRNDYISYEYRRSQLRYYDKHNSIAQRILVRVFLLAKFLPKLLDKDTHMLAYRVAGLVFNHQGRA